MSLPGHSASRSIQLHPSEMEEIKGFLLGEKKFLVSYISCSSEKPHDCIKPGCQKASCGWVWAGSPGAGPASLEKFPEIQRISKCCQCTAVKAGGRKGLQHGGVI